VAWLGMKMTKEWFRIHVVLHCLTACGLVGACSAMRHFVEFIRPQCGNLPWIVEMTYSFSGGIVILILVQTCMIYLLIFKASTTRAKVYVFWSFGILLLAIFGIVFLIRIAYLPIFDCGFGRPMQSITTKASNR
jgi:hypothetical protein